MDKLSDKLSNNVSVTEITEYVNNRTDEVLSILGPMQQQMTDIVSQFNILMLTQTEFSDTVDMSAINAAVTLGTSIGTLDDFLNAVDSAKL